MCIAPNDYNATLSIETIAFNATWSQTCVNVPIISDSNFEGNEGFTANLNTNAPRVTLKPDITEVTIVDDDSKHKPIIQV